MTILDRIVTTKRQEIAELKRCRPELVLPEHPIPRRRRFLNSIKAVGLTVIAEVKKASPSRGVIRTDFDPVALAIQFEKSGAGALSVLTDGPYFRGSPAYISDIRPFVAIPILRKEFIIDPIQIIESAELGADAILLIQAILNPMLCHQLIEAAHFLDLDVLLEIHTDEELDVALQISGVDMIGINNRNLKTFEIDITHAQNLNQKIRGIRPDLPVVAESGYQSIEDLKTLASEEFSAVLIGEGLATNPSLVNQLRLV